MARKKRPKRPRAASRIAESAFAQYRKSLHRFLVRRLANAQNAHDLAQEAYLRLLALEHAELVRAPQAYLFRIATNLLWEQRLRKQRDPVVFDSNASEFVMDRLSDPRARDPGDQIDTERLLETALAQLPPLYAAILVMKKRDGLSLEEIAEELDLSVHTVKKYLFLAIAQCRATLGLKK